ncbi:mucin-4-like isoform X2 [Mya arenaria]|uniref:mucin-4-like isoform X2 n=1 Tax=Mya arenaria TaxID=6604 RepID=UPI0022E97DB5|nr:mucin-4-like isoform X2 [Mya arenaria]
MMLYLFILSLIHHGVHTQGLFKEVDSICIGKCLAEKDWEFNGVCPQTFCDWQCAVQRLAFRTGYPVGTEYHCALNYHNRNEYIETWAVVQNCSKGEQPYISFYKNTMELPSLNGIIVCDKCNDSWYYNNKESTPSNIYHTCTLVKVNRCTLENHKLSCGIPWEDRTESDGFCRCDYKHGYAPFNGNVPMCFYSMEECDIKKCPSGHELVSNYSCVSVCPQGYYHENTSRQCLPVKSQTTHDLQVVTTTVPETTPTTLNVTVQTPSETTHGPPVVRTTVPETSPTRLKVTVQTPSETTHGPPVVTTTVPETSHTRLKVTVQTPSETTHGPPVVTTTVPETTPTPSISVTVFGIVSSITLLLILLISVGLILYIRKRTKTDADSSMTKAMNSGHKNPGLADYDLLTFDTNHRKDKTDPAKTKLDADSSTTKAMKSGHKNAGLVGYDLITFDTKHRKDKTDPAKTELDTDSSMTKSMNSGHKNAGQVGYDLVTFDTKPRKDKTDQAKTELDAGSCTTKAMNSGHKNAGLVGYDLVTFDTKHHKDKSDPAKTELDAGSCTTKAMNSGHKNAGLVGYDLVTFDTKHRKDKTDPAKTKLGQGQDTNSGGVEVNSDIPLMDRLPDATPEKRQKPKSTDQPLASEL